MLIRIKNLRGKKTLNNLLTSSLTLLCLAGICLAADGDIKVHWKGGLRLESKDKQIKLKIGGRIQHDFGFFSEDSGVRTTIGPLADGTEPRRARIYLSGTLYKHVDFKAQYDFAGGDAVFKDVYVGLGGVPGIGKIRVGHLREPFSLEEHTSSNNITFMERALPNIFSPSRNMGIKVSNHYDNKISWGVGLFQNTDNFAESTGDGDVNATARLTGTPWYKEKGKQAVHLGLSISHRSPSNPSFRYRQRPEAHLLPRFVDTGNITSSSADLVSPEFALVFGPASIQTEYVHAKLDLVSGIGNPSFHGYYLQGSYFLTGEHRNYRASEGAFKGIKPLKKVNIDNGTGAWEVAVRLSSIDLNDDTISGGRLDDVTLGLNWYLNPNARVMWNYIRADISTVGKANLFQMRLQLNF